MLEKRADDNNKVKQQKRLCQEKISLKRRADDNAKVKEEQVRRSRLCLTKKRKANPDKEKNDQNMRRVRHREVKNKYDRLREFREATKYTAVFICTCCQQRMFHSNVQMYTERRRHTYAKLVSTT